MIMTMPRAPGGSTPDGHVDPFLIIGVVVIILLAAILIVLVRKSLRVA
jgi:hypothetical protein